MRPAAVLASVFFCSGFAGLVYQVAWQRLLTLNYGVGAVSTTLIVSAFMLGLGLGSLAGGRLAEHSRNLYFLYAAVEAALAISGFASLPLIPAVGRVTAGASSATSFFCAFALLCVPTFLMGITLPLLTTIFTRTTGDFTYSISRLYFVNSLGAALGAVLTGYLLVPWLGLDGSIYLAAASDFLLAAAILLAGKAGRRVPGPKLSCRPSTDPEAGLGRVAYLLVSITGFVAIGCEIVWYRVIGILVKDSPYAFASILAVYLAGIAFGSRAIYGYLARKPGTSRGELFFTIQFLVGLSILAIFAGYYYLSRYTPLQWFTRSSFAAELHPSLALLTRRPGLLSFTNAFLFFDVFLWPLAFMLVPTLLMGASFPLISSLALTGPGSEGRTVGTTYFFAVLGNVLGGLVTGFELLPRLGTETTLLLFGLTGLLFGLAPRRVDGASVSGRCRMAGTILLCLTAVAVFPRRGDLYFAMHEAPWPDSLARLEEGVDAVVVSYQEGEQFRNFINGQGHGYRPGPLFYAEAVEGLTYASSPQNVLVIGFGAGSITQAALIPSEVRKVTVVELCGSVIKNLRHFPLIDGLLQDRKLRVVIDDGRRFLQRTDERFDVILMDPLRTTSTYSNNLHSREFFALAAKHLTPAGILMVGGVGENCDIPRTLEEEFPHVRAYPSFSLGSMAPLHQNRGRLENILNAFPLEMQAAIWNRTQDALEGPALVKATAGCRVNTDLRPASEYYLGHEFLK